MIKGFCDMLSVRVPFRSSSMIVAGDRILRLTPEGEEVWAKEMWQQVKEEATSSAVVSVRSINYVDATAPLERVNRNSDIPFDMLVCKRYGQDARSEDYELATLFIDIQGNPTKFMNKGLNVWGSFDMRETIVEFLCIILKKVGVWQEMTGHEKLNVLNLNVYATRFDYTTNLRFKTEQEKLGFLDTMEKQALSKHSVKSTTYGSSYFGSVSWIRTVFYDKVKELLAQHKKLKPSSGMTEEEVIQREEVRGRMLEASLYSGKLVRFENRIGRNYIRDKKLKKLNDLIGHLEEFEEVEIAGKIERRSVFMTKRVDGLNLGQMPVVDAEVRKAEETIKKLVELKEMKRTCIPLFRAWSAGLPFDDFCSKTTRYSCRQEILKAVKIDIMNDRIEAGKESRVVPMIRVIEASFASPCEAAMKHIHTPNADRFREEVKLHAVG